MTRRRHAGSANRVDGSVKIIAGQVDDLGMVNQAGAARVLTSSRVLLIEDSDSDMVAFLRAIKQRELPTELQRARNAAEAIKMLHLQHEEGRREHMLIVLDLNMPCMSGIEFLAELRADPCLRNAIVIAYTSSEAPADIAAAYRYNVAAYLVKDVTGDSTKSLVDLIECYLRVVTLPVPESVEA